MPKYFPFQVSEVALINKLFINVEFIGIQNDDVTDHILLHDRDDVAEVEESKNGKRKESCDYKNIWINIQELPGNIYTVAGIQENKMDEERAQQLCSKTWTVNLSPEMAQNE